jgi:DNA-binding NarL/FixJ family response regulator
MQQVINSNILLIHRSNLICEVLRESLEQRGYDVISYATSGQDGLNKIARYKPKIIIISNSLPEISGLEIVERLNSENFQGKIIFLSQNTSEACSVTKILQVDGHIHTYDGMSELFFALLEVNAGRKYISSSVEKEVSKLSKEDLDSAQLDTTIFKVLTPREIQIMQALSDSNTTPQIAKQFLISPATVNNHRANIMHKLNLKGRNQLIGVAISLKPFY